MKTETKRSTEGAFVGNVVFILNMEAKPENLDRMLLLLGRKPPATAEDLLRGHRKVGCDKWVPMGGGAHVGETEIEAAIRETKEETGLDFLPEDFIHVGILHGYIDDAVSPVWEAHLFIIPHGDMSAALAYEKDEYVDMLWFRANQLPWRQMIDGDEQWVPRILSGEKISVRVRHDSQTFSLKSVEVEKHKPA